VLIAADIEVFGALTSSQNLDDLLGHDNNVKPYLGISLLSNIFILKLFCEVLLEVYHTLFVVVLEFS
jgi:hypothetical protein